MLIKYVIFPLHFFPILKFFPYASITLLGIGCCRLNILDGPIFLEVFLLSLYTL
jgi:hypothetical protein